MGDEFLRYERTSVLKGRLEKTTHHGGPDYVGGVSVDAMWPDLPDGLLIGAEVHLKIILMEDNVIARRQELVEEVQKLTQEIQELQAAEDTLKKYFLGLSIGPSVVAEREAARKRHFEEMAKLDEILEKIRAVPEEGESDV